MVQGLAGAIEYLESQGYTIEPGEIAPGHTIATTYRVTSDKSFQSPLTVTLTPDAIIGHAAYVQYSTSNPMTWMEDPPLIESNGQRSMDI